MANEAPLKITIKTVDRATTGLRSIAKRFAAISRQSKSISARFRMVGAAAAGVGSKIGGAGLKIAALGGAAVATFGLISAKAIKAGDDLATFAAQTGIGVDAYAQLQHVANMADVDKPLFDASMRRFNRRLGLLKSFGSGPLKRLGDDLKEQLRLADGTESALTIAIGAAEKLKTASEKAGFASILFGVDSIQMAGLLSQGTESIAEQRKEFAHYAGSLDDFAKNSAIIDNSIRKMKLAFFGLSSQVLAKLFPSMDRAIKRLSEIVAGNKDEIAAWADGIAKSIDKWLDGGGLDRLIDGFLEASRSARDFVDKLGGVKNIAIGLSAVFGASLIAPIITLGVAIAALGAPVLAVTAAVSALGAASIQLYRYWDNIKTLFTDFAKPGGLLGTIHEYFKAIYGVAGDIGIGVGRAVIGDERKDYFKDLPALPPSKSESRIKVDFANVPKGTKISSESSGSSIDITRGYSMVTP
jgi:hypothetical protein